LFWLINNTRPPAPPVMAAAMLLVTTLVVAPWIILAGRRFAGDPEPARVLRRTVVVASGFSLAGLILGMLLVRDHDNAPAVIGVSIIVGGAVALVGGVLIPWIFVLVRTVTRERAARVLAEERTAVATHLHDSVLQSLILIQKQTAEPRVLRLARGTERELRAWLYGAAPQGRQADLAAVVTAAAEEIEDLFMVRVELITAGTCPLDDRAGAVAGAVREALTNAAKHARVSTVSALVEVAGAELYALVRDSGRGFDPSAHNGGHNAGRGIADSIIGRVRQHGGSATIRSAAGSGTLVEIRMPLTGAA